MARGTYEESDYFDLTLKEAAGQWTEILNRSTPAPGVRQVIYTPVETILCAAARLVVDYGTLNSSNAQDGGRPVPELGVLFKRPAKSIVDKMSNLDGKPGRSKGGKHERAVGIRLGDDLVLLAHLYRVVFGSARTASIGRDRLPDFLAVEDGGVPRLLGQEELEGQIESELRDQLADADPAPSDLTVTERQLAMQIRLGQNRFAIAVHRNCAYACIFCGFSLEDNERPTLLRAGHIKPWRASTNDERLDVANGLTACPTHDAAFDAGLITLDEDLNVIRSTRLDRAMTMNPAVATSFVGDNLRPELHFPFAARRPKAEYLNYHRDRVFR